jgi:uncharacterized membrane protein HdeD (DUF308 family)
MVRTYSRSIGIALAVLGLTGLTTPGVSGAARLPVDALNNALYLLSGIVLTVLAFNDKGAEAGTGVRVGVQASGIVYTLMGLLGLIGNGTLLGLFPVTLFHNLIHLAVGLSGIYAGFGGMTANGQG